MSEQRHALWLIRHGETQWSSNRSSVRTNFVVGAL